MMEVELVIDQYNRIIENLLLLEVSLCFLSKRSASILLALARYLSTALQRPSNTALGPQVLKFHGPSTPQGF